MFTDSVNPALAVQVSLKECKQEISLKNIKKQSSGDSLHEILKPVFWKNKKNEKIFQYVISWKFYPECQELSVLFWYEQA